MRLIISLIFGSALVLLPVAAWPYKAPVQGTVRMISSGSIRVLNQLTHLEVQFDTTPQTKFKGVNKLRELFPGDDVKVEYTKEDNVRIATRITKETI